MEQNSNFDIPLDTLSQGVHDYAYELDNEFFEAFAFDLVMGGQFTVKVEVERIRNQFNLKLNAEGKAQVECDRCLEDFQLPLNTSFDIVIKFDSDAPREDEDVIFVSYGTERFNVAKLIYDAIGLALPISKTHDNAGEACNPDMTKYLVEEDSFTSELEEKKDEIPEDSPWSALRGFGSQEN